MKKYKYSKLVEKDIVKRCPSCEGSGRWYGHGAFGEPESDTCGRCRGEGVILNWDNINREK